MPLTAMLIILGVLAALVLAVGGVALALRLAPMTTSRRLMAFGPTRRLLMSLGMRAARAKAKAEGTDTDARGVGKTDIQIALEQDSSPEAAQARAILSQLSPQQRRMAERMMTQSAETLMAKGGGGADGADRAPGEDDAPLAGVAMDRATRRRVARANKTAAPKGASRQAGARSKVRKRKI